MTEGPVPPKEAASALAEVLPTALEVVTDPRGFFSSMPREGGYEAPGIFAGVMLIVYGAILALFSLLHANLIGVVSSLVVVPVLGAIGLGIGAAILLFLSRALGGAASFESSLRIVAYTTALVPVQAVAFLIPYAPILVQAYQAYIVIIAVIAVHKVAEEKAWTVLGSLAAVLLLLSLFATFTSRRVSPKLDNLQRQLDKAVEQMRRQQQQ